VNGRIDDLKLLVEREAKCRATHVTSQTIHERYEGMRVWDGIVEIFQLEGHPTANRAYAWAILPSEGQQIEYKVILGLPPVNSAEDAVRVSITAGFRQLVDLAREILDK
jgi:hypothetical protein